jgi:hypothetical protein
MRKHIQGIDHVVIATRDLDAARDSFARMGFTVTPRGYHTLGSENHCVMLGDDYFELLAVPKIHPATQFYADFLSAGDGLAAIALKTDSARGAYTEWLWSGLAPSDVVDFSRPVELPGGARDASFRITQLPNDKSPGGRVFCCEHLTRDVVWRPEWQAHANGATALAAVAIVAEDVEEVTRQYEKVFDARAERIAEGLLVQTGNTPIAVATERALAKRFPGLWITGRPYPAYAALFFRVPDRDRAEVALRKGGFDPQRMPDGSVALGADQAHGVAVLFG